MKGGHRLLSGIEALRVMTGVGVLCLSLNGCAGQKPPPQQTTPIAFTEDFVASHRIGLNIATQISEKKEYKESADTREVFGLACIAGINSSGTINSSVNIAGAYASYCAANSGKMDGEFCIAGGSILFRSSWVGHPGGFVGNACPGGQDFHVWEPKSSAARTSKSVYFPDHESPVQMMARLVLDLSPVAERPRLKASIPPTVDTGDQKIISGAFNFTYFRNTTGKDSLEFNFKKLCSESDGSMRGHLCYGKNGEPLFYTRFQESFIDRTAPANTGLPGTLVTVFYDVREAITAAGRTSLIQEDEKATADERQRAAQAAANAAAEAAAARKALMAEFESVHRGDKVCAKRDVYGQEYVGDVDDKENLKYKIIIQGVQSQLINSNKQIFRVNQVVWEPAENWYICYEH